MRLTRASLSLAAVSAEALKVPHQTTTTTAQSSGKLLVNFEQSHLEFDHWVDRMVEKGQLYRPNITSTGLIQVREDGKGWKVTLKNVACSTVTGNKDLLERAEAHFCDDFIKNAGNIMAREMELDVTRLLCDNGIFCKLGVKSVFDFFHLFPTADDIAGVCHDMFNAVQNACPDGGGVADTEVTYNGAAEVGQLEFSYTLGNGNECKEDPTHQCFDRDIQ
ncbi:hypothetical protein ACLX1H_011265 [Fusarium chlamydosporum]